LLNETKKEIMVFDAKFKSSQWFNREDFYKTATYISYYQNHGYKVILSGQIYPDKDADKINQNLGFLDSDVDFRIFGIDLMDEIVSKENKKVEFIEEVLSKKNLSK
jgi:hypothetical protein